MLFSVRITTRGGSESPWVLSPWGVQLASGKSLPFSELLYDRTAAGILICYTAILFQLCLFLGYYNCLTLMYDTLFWLTLLLICLFTTQKMQVEDMFRLYADEINLLGKNSNTRQKNTFYWAQVRRFV